MTSGEHAFRTRASHHEDAASYYRLARLTKRLYPCAPDVLARVEFFKKIGEHHAWLAKIDELTGRKHGS